MPKLKVVAAPPDPVPDPSPPEAVIEYPPAPVVIGADLNDGEAQLGIHGVVDDLFIIGRAISPAEMTAYRERRQYCPDTLTATVTP